MTIKILNLYAGIGGNRKLWEGDIEVTAIENNKKIAKLYQKFFPKDKVIVADAHNYLLKHFKEFDFIWSSPPCPTYSDIRRCGVNRGQNEAVYPDMKLYEEIILLTHFAPKGCKWIIENVKPYYTPLIKPKKVGRHFFWSNYPIVSKKLDNIQILNKIIGSNKVYGFDVKNEDIRDKRKVLRNMVNPELGLHLFELSFHKPQLTLKTEKK